MLLECEKRDPIPNASEKQVRSRLSKLRSYGPSSFASLTRDGGSYVQVAGGGVTCMLEYRDVDAGKVFRAYQDSLRPTCPDGTLLTFGGGRIAMQSDEWFSIENVIEVFLAFLNGEDFPQWIHWRDITHLFSKPA